MTDIEEGAIATIQEIAALAATATDRENAGAAQIAIIATAYSSLIGGLLHEGFITLEEALRCTSADLVVVQNALREIAATGELP